MTIIIFMSCYRLFKSGVSLFSISVINTICFGSQKNPHPPLPVHSTGVKVGLGGLVVVSVDVWGCCWYLEGAFPDRSSRQATRAAWRQSQCVSSGSAGGAARAVSALSGSVSSSSSLSSLGPARPTATGPITPDTRKYAQP